MEPLMSCCMGKELLFFLILPRHVLVSSVQRECPVVCAYWPDKMKVCVRPQKKSHNWLEIER